jgi:2-polyprenyl-3-methyl-5-hydroxy-6-metoxy-1,4-benzoquinol methylase
VIEQIIKNYSQSEYDFRTYTNPNDPLKHLFEDWVPYYRLKFEIAALLQPKSILEVGVRFGYSARAFLDGSRSASYLGIDLDSDLYGGVKGAIKWAKQITQDYNATYLIANTQHMSEFPGGQYDLIHVDGQQDGDGTFHDLELAIRQAKYVLVDGAFFTRLNFQAVSEFLYSNKTAIEYYAVIPGYAGELLICTKSTNNTQVVASGSDELIMAYSEDYYLDDCGGYDSYLKFQGKKITDPRLMAMATLGSIAKGGRVVDLGCGRGELTYHFAQQGKKVTAIDYSSSAVKLTKACFEGEPEALNRTTFVCKSVTEDCLEGQYDLAIAADLIEHLAPEELDKLYSNVVQHLSADGVFVLHTFPNKWIYQYEHPRKRRIASSVGAFLPSNPRTEYERLMHINEQSPKVLKRQLLKHFPHVLMWFGTPEDPLGSLGRKYSIADMRAAPDVFAIASLEPINPEDVVGALSMRELTLKESMAIQLNTIDVPNSVSTEEVFSLSVEIKNNSGTTVSSQMPYPVQISYRWLKKGEVVVDPGLRSKLHPLIEIGKSRTYELNVNAPLEKGIYELRVTLVQEFIRWFDQSPLTIFNDTQVEVL